MFATGARSAGLLPSARASGPTRRLHESRPSLWAPGRVGRSWIASLGPGNLPAPFRVAGPRVGLLPGPLRPGLARIVRAVAQIRPANHFGIRYHSRRANGLIS